MNVVHVGVGPISESDLALAKACKACIVGFNIRSPSNSVIQEAERDSIKVQTVAVVISCTFVLRCDYLLPYEPSSSWF